VANLQTEWTADELLATDEGLAPLVAGGVRCHGGFDDDGEYVSPRTRFRRPAIEAWQEQHRLQFGTDLLTMPLDTWPEHYPNVEQAKHLLREGVRDPLVATLTRIGTVEGFGAMIGNSAVENIQKWFDDPLAGTAIDHLDKGLLQAHARDEAGYREEAGHKQMWYATRDVAFEHPLSADEEAEIVSRTTLGAAGQAGNGPAMPKREREMLEDIEPTLLALTGRMIRILLIEIQAFHTFAWAEAVLSDNELVAGEGDAARIVSFIRQDETPHVEYLRTALTEMRDRTFVGVSGRKHAGDEVVGSLWDRAVTGSIAASLNHEFTLNELDLALAGNPRRDSILEGFHSLA
jgi:hypothetical protein